MNKEKSIANSAPTRMPRRLLSRSHLIELAQNFASLDRPTAAEINQFRDMFYILILKTTPAERMEISHILSRGHYTPRPVALYFGMEGIEIAAPMLLFSPVLNAIDLMQIVKKATSQHAKHVLQRNGLDISVVDALIKADKGFGELKALIRRNSDLKDREDVRTLLDSPTLPANGEEISAEKVPAPESKNNKVSQATGHGRFINRLSGKNEARSEVRRDLSNRLLNLARLSKENKRRPQFKSARRNMHEPKPVAEHLLDLARSQDLKEMTSRLTSLTGMNSKQVSQIISGNNAGMLASLLRAIGISKTSASKLLLLLNRDVGRNAMVFKTIMRKYERLSEQECQAFFNEMGATFAETDEGRTMPKTHISHFAALLAERRRDIAEQVPRRYDASEQEQKQSA